MNAKLSRRSSAVLVAVFDATELRVFRAHQSTGAIELSAPAAIPLPSDWTERDPIAVGGELRRQLNAAGRSERCGVAALPMEWFMTHSCAAPALSGDDLAGFLEIEAEKGFPVEPSELQIAPSIGRYEAGTRVTQFAARKDHVEHVASILRAAGVKPLGVTLGVTALPELSMGTEEEGRVVVIAEPAFLMVAVCAAGAIAIFRRLDAEAVTNPSVAVRELSITWEQIPVHLRGSVGELILRTSTGDERLRALREAVGRWAKTRGLLQREESGPAGALSDRIAQALGAAWLRDRALPLEFLPAAPSRWFGLKGRWTSRRIWGAGCAAAAVVLTLVALYSSQEYKLLSLRSRWRAMEGEVNALKGVQANIREFRPWYDTSFHDLKILKSVTESFPDTGAVTARAVQLRGLDAVTISGAATDNTALLHTLDQLRKAKQVSGLKVEQIRGKTPEQFTLSFLWTGGPST